MIFREHGSDLSAWRSTAFHYGAAAEYSSSDVPTAEALVPGVWSVHSLGDNSVHKQGGQESETGPSFGIL